MASLRQGPFFCVVLGVLFSAVCCIGAASAQTEKSREPEASKPEAQGEPALANTRPKDAKELFAAFATMPGLEARYTEKKYLSLLVVPLESRGRLYFLQPGYLSRVVEAPEKSTLIITPDELRMNGRDGEEVINLHQSDRLHLFVTSLVRVFHGEREAIERLYRVDYSKSEEDDKAWRLELLPRDKPLTQMLKGLVLRGSGLAVTEIEVREPNGDRTVTVIVESKPGRVFDKAEKARIFGIEADEPPVKESAKKNVKPNVKKGP